MEYRIDGRFPNINKLEEHMVNLVNEINPRAMYENFCKEFHRYVVNGDYQSVLRVYNQKSMLPDRMSPHCADSTTRTVTLTI